MTEKTPELLRPFATHGVDLRPGSSQSDDWRGDCPFCGKERHFFANPKRGTWDCKVCGESGNVISFLTVLADRCARETSRTDLAEMSKRRGIPVGVLRSAGVGRHGGRWLVPAYSKTGTVHDIRVYDGKKMMCTAGCKSQLWGADRLALTQEGDTVLLCEGEWDGLAGWWLKRDSERPFEVVAVPGATVFKPEWVEGFAGRHVITVYDHDDAGDRGQIKSDKMLRGFAASIRHVCWPETSPDGYDLRDFVRERAPVIGADKTYDELVSLARETPRREVGDGSGGHPGESASGKVDESQVPESTLEQVMEAFRERLDVNAEFAEAVEVLLAIAASSPVADDPVWLYLMGPAGTGKTELLTSLIGSSKCVFRSTVTPKCLVSGFRGEGEKDPSLIPKLKGKTLVAKDFTEVLSLPDVQQKEIYSTLRGAFDGYVDKTFGNGAERHYRDCKFSIVAGVTTAILKHRESAMGERFLKFRIKRLDSESARARARRSLENLGEKKAKGEELQKVVAGFLKRPLPDKLPRFSETAFDELVDMAEMVSKMRVQVERDQRTDNPQYIPEAEGLDRVAKQLGTVARMLAWMRGHQEVGESELRTVRKIAFDTVCGFDSDIVESVVAMGGRATKKAISEACAIPTSTVARRIEDLLLIGLLKQDGQSTAGGAGGRPATVYRIREELAAVWRRMKGAAEWKATESKDADAEGAAEDGDGQTESAKSQSSSKRTVRRLRRGSRRAAV